MTGLAVTRTGAPKGKEIPLDFPIEKILAYYEGKAPRELAPPATGPSRPTRPWPSRATDGLARPRRRSWPTCASSR